MNGLTPIFERFDIVAVPFPYVERDTLKHRPALVVSAKEVAERHGFAWVLMITSADNPSWPNDIPIKEPKMAGLPRPSVIRPVKIATVEMGRCEGRGRLDPRTQSAVEKALQRILA
jgi:mRNA interferase MazF